MENEACFKKIVLNTIGPLKGRNEVNSVWLPYMVIEFFTTSRMLKELCEILHNGGFLVEYDEIEFFLFNELLHVILVNSEDEKDAVSRGEKRLDPPGVVRLTNVTLQAIEAALATGHDFVWTLIGAKLTEDAFLYEEENRQKELSANKRARQIAHGGLKEVRLEIRQAYKNSRKNKKIS